ncbi:hypothetical protein RGR602_PB00319 (plasmid) [Rhizobium gallicum bv. gallicum R602sp]|uniref:Uncharacterized protein n=1 Tax=Rhizobium gallicum bv. gallicum R602sp TaxID=1041138 RepID=A0A0B4XB70_9HYPH|nr:hypothetical protein RGR602_PB00319 [Rhizobium gallicum bv. gallicum R602sp]
MPLHAKGEPSARSFLAGRLRWTCASQPEDGHGMGIISRFGGYLDQMLVHGMSIAPWHAALPNFGQIAPKIRADLAR